jgi:hypothetical protein
MWFATGVRQYVVCLPLLNDGATANVAATVGLPEDMPALAHAQAFPA